MPRTRLVAFMTHFQLLPHLTNIINGKILSVPEWLLEGLQDRGFIDHKNKLTDDGLKFYRRD